jgi:DNA-binding CsgD family transcriptional regulator
MGLSDLLGDLYDEAGDTLPAPQRAALGAALLRVTPANGEAAPTAVSAGALGLLRAAARDGPVLIAIDDLQWLDGSTAATVRFALRRLDATAAVRLLASARTGVDHDVASIGEGVTRLPLGPLGLDELARLAARELRRPLPRPVMRRIERMAGGNAFVALELARAAITRRPSETWMDDTVSLDAARRLAAERLATLPEMTTQSLAAVAALARPSTALVAAAVGDEGRLDPAFRAGVLAEEEGEVRFAHPLLAAAALAALTPRERRVLHARLAQVTEDAEARARHLAAATLEPDSAVAAALDAGAALALGRGAPAAAAELWEHAARLTPASRRADRGARLLQAGSHHGVAADAGRALQLFRRAGETLPAGSLRAEALIAVACHEQTPSREGLVLGREALAQCGEDRAARARCLARFTARLMMAGDWRAAGEHAREAVALLDATADTETRAWLLGLAGGIDTVTIPGGGRDVLRRARQYEGTRLIPDAYESPTAWLGLSHLWTDELGPARVLLSDARARGEAAGQEAAAAVLHGHLADLECRAGNLERARAYADHCLAISEQGEDDQGLAAALSMRALVAVHAGDEQLARELIARGLAITHAIDEHLVAVWLHCHLGFLELSVGNAAAAVAQLEPMPGLLQTMGVREPGVWLCHAELIEALIASGKHVEAEERLAAWAALGREIDRPRVLCTAARARGLLDAERGDVQIALRHLEHALVLHDRLPIPLERGRTLLALGTTHRRAGHRRAARETLDTAEAIFEEIGACAWAHRSAAERARVSGRSAHRSEELTATERQVADLVAVGRTNREVAQKLFVTIRTVESNLTRVYSKLGVRSRGELAARRGEW